MKGSTIRLAANVATVCFVLVIILQLLLAAGLLPITMAWGGTQAVLTPTLRLASLAAVVILALFTYVIRRRAGLVGDKPVSTGIKILSWLITAFMLLNTLGNLTSTSMGEKILFTPITLVLVVSCFLVSISKTDSQ